MKRTKTNRGIKHESVMDVIVRAESHDIKILQARICSTAQHTGYTEKCGIVYPLMFWSCELLE